jgi:predicted phage tail protein
MRQRASQKTVTPTAADAAASRSLTRHAGHRAELLSDNRQEAIMSIEQQIEELRAELSTCGNKREKAQIEREYRAAKARLEALIGQR